MCPSPGILGSNIITDPGGEPLPPDQSPFSVRRRFAASLGEIIARPPSVDYALHPGNIDGTNHPDRGNGFQHDPTFCMKMFSTVGTS